jgi:hypothetical protein
VAAPLAGNGATEWHEVRPNCWRSRRPHASAIQLQRFGAWLGLSHTRIGPGGSRRTRGARPSPGSRRCATAPACSRWRSSSVIASGRETDHGYAGSDYRLNQEIDAEILQQSINAWEHMLAAPGLGGRAGEEIVANRPRFRGKRMKEDLSKLRAPAGRRGLVLGVCDWGFCVYREEHSACLGNAAGPEPRSPRAVDLRALQELRRCRSSIDPTGSSRSTAASGLLDEPALPRQTLRIVRTRLDEARSC